MAKKHKSAKSHARPSAPSFNPEDWPYFTPLVFVVLFIALVVLFSDFVFSDKMLHMSDQIQAGVFFRTFLVDYVQQHGAVPQWNPYIFGGMPYVEAFHGDIFYPLSVLKFIAGTYRWQGWTLFFHIFLAGLFMYLAARQFKLSKIASLLAAACYMFSSYLVSLVAPGHDGKVYITTLFPLVIYFLDRGLGSEHFRTALFNFSMLGLVIGVAILSPHPQMSYFLLWAAAFYTVFRLIVVWRESGTPVSMIRPATLALYAVIIGLLMSAIQFYPGYSYTTNFSPRSEEKSGWDWATSWSMHEEEAFSQIIPEFCGTSSRSERTYYWGKNVFKDNSESAGVVAIFVGLMGAFFCRRKEAYFFAGLALFAFVYALGATTPIFRIFYYVIPMVKSLRAPSMIMFIFSFSVALLAGMGVQRIIEERDKVREKLSKNFSYLLFGFPGLLLLLALLFHLDGRSMLSVWASLFYSDASTTMVQEGVSKLDLAYLNLPAIQSGAWLAFLFSALAALAIWLYRSGKAGIWALVALMLLPVIAGVRFNQRFVKTADPANFWSPNPVSEFFASRPEKYRVMNFATRMVAEDLLPFFGVEVVVGYHGNQLRWYDHLLGGLRKSNQFNPRFLNLVGARYMLLPAGQQLPEGYLGEKPMMVASDLGSLQIWENENALPRCFLVSQSKVIGDGNELRKAVVTGTDNLREIVYLEQQPEHQYNLDTAGNDSVWIIDHQVDSVLLGVSCDDNKILVLTDNYYDAWHAYVDGVERPVLRSYGSFRAVEIPAGTERVLFKYRSMRYRTGKLVTALTSLYLLVIIGTYAFTTRRNKIKRKRA